MVADMADAGRRDSVGEPSPPSKAGILAQAWLSGVKLVVWDFDMCLLKIHAFGEGVEPAEVESRWRNDVADVELVQTGRAHV